MERQWTRRAAVLGAVATGALGVLTRDGAESIPLEEVLSTSRTPSLELRPGATYTLRSPVDLTGRDINGNGAVVIVECHGTSPGGILKTRGTMGLRNLTVLGVAAQRPGPTLVEGRFGPSADVRVEITGLTIRGCFEAGLSIAASEGPGHIDLSLHDISVEGSTRGIVVDVRGRVSVSNCSVRSAFTHGITIVGATSSTLRKLRADECGGSGVVLLYCQRVHLMECRVTGNSQHGLNVGGGRPDRSPSRGIYIRDLWAAKNGFSGCTVDTTISGHRQEPVYGDITFQGGGALGNRHHGINVQNTTGVTISHMNLSNNRRCGAGLSSSGVSLAGCRIERNHAWGVGLFAPYPSAVERLFLRQNHFAGNQFGPVRPG